ncbi:MAG: 3-dehydroquinate synthase [Chlamydiae bacterium]|nr:3-dehydroquinate synthase [Chlamydiota bacterium]MBI3276229.1 3-dehydroquinate synthase [Chlamydiota bacterium]
MTIQSHRGPYTVHFKDDPFSFLNDLISSSTHFIVDEKVASLYAQELNHILKSPSILLIPATEMNKSLDQFCDYIEHLVRQNIRRGHLLIAIGGGIIQDITCFLAAVLLRGLDWYFFPTTLLAQADSCIGSKSSINVGKIKNIVGTFTPPRKIVVSLRFLDSLDERDLRSGIGEMLKVSLIEGPRTFDQIAADYPFLLKDRALLEKNIYQSLKIKQRIIEVDEFDQGIRNIMNYGHSFGHAIESATDFAIPHGIAVSMGMDMANFVSVQLGNMKQEHFDRVHPILKMNYQGYENIDIPFNPFLDALGKDKKNTNSHLTLILPDAVACIVKKGVSNDERFHDICSEYFHRVRQ